MTLPFSIPSWIYALAAATAFAGIAWLVLCAIRAAYRAGRLAAFQEIERKHGFIRGAHAWFIIIPQAGCPKLAREGGLAPQIKTIPDNACHRDLARKAKAHLN